MVIVAAVQLSVITQRSIPFAQVPAVVLMIHCIAACVHPTSESGIMAIASPLGYLANGFPRSQLPWSPPGGATAFPDFRPAIRPKENYLAVNGVIQSRNRSEHGPIRPPTARTSLVTVSGIETTGRARRSSPPPQGDAMWVVTSRARISAKSCETSQLSKWNVSVKHTTRPPPSDRCMTY